MRHLFRQHRLDTPLLLCLGLITLALLALTGSASLQRTMTEILIRVVIVVGMFSFIGHSGVISFGHIAFVGIGAYAAAWTTMEPSIKQFVLTGLPNWLAETSWHWIPAALAGAALASLVALVVGSIILRLTGIAASIATFSMLAIFNVVYSNWDTVTAGSSSIVGVPTPVGIWQALGAAAVAILVAHLHAQSRFGLALQAVREEPVAAISCGVNAWRYALIAFVLSAAICGVGGAMDAQFIGVVSPDAYYLGRTFTCLTMLVIGGSATLSGAVAGVVSLSLLIETLVKLESGIEFGSLAIQLPSGSQEIALGLTMMVVLVLRPGGLMRGRDLRWPAPQALRGSSSVQANAH